MNYNNWRKEKELDNSKYLRTTPSTITSQSNCTMSSLYTMTSSNNSFVPHDKVVSISDDRVDSGIASITFSEEENNRYIDEMCASDNLTDTRQTDNVVLPTDRQESTRQQQTEIIEDEAVYSTTSDYNSYSDELLNDLIIPYKPDKFGYSDLHVAIFNKDVAQAITLIEECPSPVLLNVFTPDIHSSLHLAVYANLPEIVRFLVIFGADIQFKDKRGNTPLHTACELGRLNCVRMLLLPFEEKENIGLQDSKIPQDVNEKNYEGLTPLHLATIHNHNEVVKFLLRQTKCNANIGDSNSGRTALHHALERHCIESFYSLLEVAINVNATTYDGCAPLHIAVGLNLEHETRSLMSQGANVSMETHEEIKPLDLAKTEGLRRALMCTDLQAVTRGLIKQR